MNPERILFAIVAGVITFIAYLLMIIVSELRLYRIVGKTLVSEWKIVKVAAGAGMLASILFLAV